MSLTNHPNLVKAYCSFVVDQSVWVVMPYMAGGSCLHIMKSTFQDGFEEPVIATVLKESLKALEYLHRQGHIHRDVKAGNILLDGDGSVKLGDFGVSASMFDTGDRQRSRTTFVGTPCWMAPEVIEKLHGYDFKADIWSFGITALELAHGHAPFSKYPPMKVLLMTLQNAPPGLDLERDKKFSKSFKEMIAMCLVKEPTRRPSAERLLRHSFFKHARSSDYIYRHVLDGLPPLGERVKNLKLLDATRLAEKKIPFEEQEQKSQTEYKRGVSAWNFNIEDLKAQAALILGDDDHAESVKEEDDPPKQQALKGHDDIISDAPSHFPSLVNTYDGSLSQETGQPPVTLHIVKVETANEAGDQRVTRVRSGTLPIPVQSTKPTNGQKPGPVSGKREPKHIGRFDVFEDDTDMESPGNQGLSRSEDPARKDREDQRELRKSFNDRDRREEHREHRRHEERDRDEARKCVSNSLVAERNRAREDDRERDKELRQGGRLADDQTSRHRERAFSGPLATGERAVSDQRPANGVNQGASRPSSGIKEVGMDEKSKGSAQKAPVVQRGRFSVTSDDMNAEDPPHGMTRRNPNSQGLALPPVSSLSNLNSSGSVPVVALLPHLQNALNHAVMQQDALFHVLNSINPGEASTQPRMHNTLKHSRSSNSYIGAGDYSTLEISNDRERDLLQQIAELQSKIAVLVDELQAMKLKNVSLERQLNAHYNREEEERIRKEEAANDDG
ncbi:hypothetical protein M758_1G027500 [Ceratodon purpureus]|nr:hypothetical protein M758_1G027500 [Ceratodon purpureus]